MSAKIVQWLIFSVCLALTPVLTEFLVVILLDKGANWGSILTGGQLLLIAAAISAAAIGEIVFSDYNHKIYKSLAAGGCVICLFSGSMLFAFISSAEKFNADVDINVLLAVTVIMFGFSLISSFCCVVISKLKND